MNRSMIFADFQKILPLLFAMLFLWNSCAKKTAPLPPPVIEETSEIIEPEETLVEEIAEVDESSDQATENLEPEIIEIEEPPNLTRIDQSSISFVDDDLSVESLERAVRNSLVYYGRLDESEEFFYGKDSYTVGEMKQSMQLFLQILKTSKSKAEFRQRMIETFEIYESPGDSETGEVLFTAYYEPVLSASSVSTDSFRYPAYAVPKDLNVLRLDQFRSSLEKTTIVYRMENGKPVPYHSRREIMKDGKLQGKAKTLAWFEDPVDLFFLQVQGSGIVRFENGKQVRLGYAGANGRDYFSIGRLLIRENKIPREEVSLQSIRKYLRENKNEVERILFSNESYTFFQYQTLDDGPFGSINVSLTPYRSIATDYKLFPKGSLALIETSIPKCNASGICSGEKQIFRFVLNQDTGGAIRGFGRADIFMGRGAIAEATAGRQKNKGKLQFLIAKKEFLNSTLSQK